MIRFARVLIAVFAAASLIQTARGQAANLRVSSDVARAEAKTRGYWADPQTRQMEGWASLYTGPCRTRVFEGGHFYLADQRRAVADALAEDVLAAVPAQ